MSVDRRFPRSVYGEGEEPDPRFSLANERTFLAWLRTALAMYAAFGFEEWGRRPDYYPGAAGILMRLRIGG